MAMHLNRQFFQDVLPEVTFMGQDLPAHGEFCVDSRLTTDGDIFIALKGKNVDGHDFVKDAIKRGVLGIIISKDRQDILKTIDSAALKRIFVALVPSTHEALLTLATAWRAQFTYPIIGITGSIGKTSTKEMLANILKLNDMPFIASYGNQNTSIGMSLNILRMRSNHQIAIFEMGVNKRGEMAKMAAIVRPTTAIITSIGHSHMEGLGSLADIANEKRDIFKYFTEENIGIIHGDQPILANVSYTHPIVKFGCKTTNQVQARKIQANNLNSYFMLKLYKDRYKIMLDTNHAGRVINALAASAVAHLLGIKPDVIIKGIQVPLTITGRFEQTYLKAAKGLLINDCYNASPESMKAALLAFEKVESKGQKIAVLADMLELGVNSSFWHRQVGRFLRKVPSLHHLILVGDMIKWTKNTLPVGLSFEHVATWQEATECVRKRLDREAVILVKGSCGMGLSNLVKELVDAPL
jgi:UDP-N-acetylmuramoyl-tripeptide--D-alanyl-D-alanine ligase